MTGTNADVPNDATELLRKWARGFRLTEGLKEGQTVEPLYEQIHPCLTISRETGAGASHVAQRIGERAQYILPRKKCLALRVIAPLESRVARIMARQQLNRDEAERYAKQRDAARGEFGDRRFGTADGPTQLCFPSVPSVDSGRISVTLQPTEINREV
jgi:hypothetical protein